MKYNKLPTIKFDQYWQGVEWAAKQNFDKDILENQISNINIPDASICESLQVMHDFFYPNEDYVSIGKAKELLASLINPLEPMEKYLRDDCLPWIWHQALFDAKEDPKIELSEDSYHQILARILETEWLLTWHWRAVLPSLREWKPADRTKKLIIQISHIRKWELLLCYRVDIEELSAVDKISDIDLTKKTLLRAPLFGISHRLRGWDAYRLFYQDEIKDYVTNKSKEKINNRFGTSFEYVLGRHDCYYVVEDVEQNARGYTWTLKTFINIEPEKGLIDKEILGNTSEAYYFKPPDLIDIPSFGGHRGTSQLLSSDNYCEAIFELTEVLNSTLSD